MIKQQTIFDGLITEFIAEGPITADDVIETIRNCYPLITKHVLWNQLDADVTAINVNDMKRIAEAGKKYSKHEKTAFLGESDFTFAMLRMYQAYSEMNQVPLQMRVFRDRNEAILWLKEGSA